VCGLAKSYSSDGAHNQPVGGQDGAGGSQGGGERPNGGASCQQQAAMLERQQQLEEQLAALQADNERLETDRRDMGRRLGEYCATVAKVGGGWG
jgi:hypothetical protein